MLDKISTDDALLDLCRRRAIDLLKRNLTSAGIRAAKATRRAEQRGYTAIFGRDAAICALGMALSGDPLLRREAARGIVTLARYQAPNGQMPKFVDVRRREADFWYVGCIDATLWWLIAVALLDAWGAPAGLRHRYRGVIERALGWLRAQEHQRFYLLQQNEASDWADIMPRSGFVLYTNALWYYVKRLYSISHAAATRSSFNGLFHPFSAQLSKYRRAHLLADYVLRRAARRRLYLSFVNFSFFGDENDVFGNLLAVVLGLPDAAASARTLRALLATRANDPYPARTVTRPIRPGSRLWRPYMARHRQNFSWQYHNGGIWPLLGGFWVVAMVAGDRMTQARRDLVQLASSCRLGGWRFSEWLDGRTLALRGMPGQSWSAAAFLLAAHALETGTNPFQTRRRPHEGNRILAAPDLRR
ncbi:MAG TPA: glycoside hydrolase 100 family protein [Steroidobacteraceae bacterium]|nr:glycoside hydrolase 100 family protein [Steroidobacteraceae bacterium]